MDQKVKFSLKVKYLFILFSFTIRRQGIRVNKQHLRYNKKMRFNPRTPETSIASKKPVPFISRIPDTENRQKNEVGVISIGDDRQSETLSTDLEKNLWRFMEMPKIVEKFPNLTQDDVRIALEKISDDPDITTIAFSPNTQIVDLISDKATEISVLYKNHVKTFLDPQKNMQTNQKCSELQESLSMFIEAFVNVRYAPLVIDRFNNDHNSRRAHQSAIREERNERMISGYSQGEVMSTLLDSTFLGRNNSGQLLNSLGSDKHTGFLKRLKEIDENDIAQANSEFGIIINFFKEPHNIHMLSQIERELQELFDTSGSYQNSAQYSMDSKAFTKKVAGIIDSIMVKIFPQINTFASIYEPNQEVVDTSSLNN
mgnify:CR=1 FL=1